MNMLASILFGAAFLMLLVLHLAGARWALSHLKSHSRNEIDMESGRADNFDATMVRTGRRAADSLQTAFHSAPHSSSGIVHTLADCVMGENSTAQAVVSEADLTLLDGSRIVEFADCEGVMTLASHCTVGGHTASRTEIRLGSPVRLGSASAPLIRSAGGGLSVFAPRSPGPVLRISREDSHPDLLRLATDTWLCRGDFHAGTLILEANLVVLGSFSAGPESNLSGDIRASGNLRVAAGSVCRGNLVCGGDMILDEETRFERVLRAGRSLRLEQGVRGEGPLPVVAYANDVIILGPDVLIRGKVASATGIEVRP